MTQTLGEDIWLEQIKLIKITLYQCIMHFCMNKPHLTQCNAVLYRKCFFTCIISWDAMRLIRTYVVSDSRSELWANTITWKINEKPRFNDLEKHSTLLDRLFVCICKCQSCQYSFCAMLNSFYFVVELQFIYYFDWLAPPILLVKLGFYWWSHCRRNLIIGR